MIVSKHLIYTNIRTALFQELFSKSKTIVFCIENSTLRVIHKSLIFDAVKEGEETYLAEVLGALEEKYKKKESWIKLMLAWFSSKLWKN